MHNTRDKCRLKKTVRQNQPRSFKGNCVLWLESQRDVSWAWATKTLCFIWGARVWRNGKETQDPHGLRSREKVCGVVLSYGVGLLCFLKFKVQPAIDQEVLRNFKLPYATMFHGDFQQDLTTVQSVNSTNTCYNLPSDGWSCLSHKLACPHRDSMRSVSKESWETQQCRQVKGQCSPNLGRTTSWITLYFTLLIQSFTHKESWSIF